VDPFEPKDWEPRSLVDWLRLNPFSRIEAPFTEEYFSEFVESVEAPTFEAWRRLPAPLRQQVWREREIAATLYSRTHRYGWANNPHLSRVGVERRQQGGRSLVGILLMDFPSWAPQRSGYDVESFGVPVPPSISVESAIPSELLESGTEEVPLVIEYEPRHVPFTQIPPHTPVSASDPPPLSSVPALRAGDFVAGENPAGFRRLGTLSAIVDHQALNIPCVLSAAHVLGE